MTYIDFPNNTFRFEDISQIINQDNSLYYAPPEEKAPRNLSWWRFRTGEFDSIHMVLRKDELRNYNFQDKSWVELMREIVDVHKK